MKLHYYITLKSQKKTILIAKIKWKTEHEAFRPISEFTGAS